METGLNVSTKNTEKRRRYIWSNIKEHWMLYLMVVPGALYFIIFAYVPIMSSIIAFQDYQIMNGVLGSPWVGFKHFRYIFSYHDFLQAFRNTLAIASYSLIFGFPAPILLALLLNEIRGKKFKRVVQSFLYLPHFLSWVIVAGLVFNLLSLDGVVNTIREVLGLESVIFLQREKYFRPIIILSSIWKNVGWGTIIYLASITGVSPSLYEAAIVDGAGRFKQAIHITIPAIIPTIIVLLLINIGNFLELGFEQMYNFLTPMTYSVGDIIETYVFRSGVEQGRYSITTAVGMFQSVIGLILLWIFNSLARKTEQGLW